LPGVENWALYGEAVQFDEDEEFIDQRNVLHSLRQGSFVVFQREDDRKWNALHVGEVVLPYNPITHEVRIHHYVDLGANGRHWDVTKELSTIWPARRRGRPEAEGWKSLWASWHARRRGLIVNALLRGGLVR